MGVLHVPRPLVAPAVRLFCFPYAGGSAAAFYPWASLFPPGTELNIIQLPGHGERLNEPLAHRVDPLVDALLTTLLPRLQEPGTRSVFWGHSLGALLAFTLTHRLQAAQALLPQRLVVSGRPAPSIPLKTRQLHTLPDAEFDAGLRTMEGTPEEILANAELMSLFRPILRADLEMAETWCCPPAPPLPVPIDVMGGEGEFGDRPQELAAWERETSAGCQVVLFPGGHFFIHSARAQVVEFLSRSMG